MKNQIVLLICCLFFSTSSIAKIKIAALYWSMKIEGQVIMRQGLEESLAEYNKKQTQAENKIELVGYVAGEGAPGVQKQYLQFNEAIQSNPDLIIIQPTDNAVLSEGLKLANLKNIPVVVYDQYIVDGYMSSIITSDNFGAGWSNGQYISDMFDDQNEIKLVIFEYSRISGTTERVDGFMSSLRKSGQKFKVLGRYEAVDPSSGKIAAEKFLKDFPQKNSVDVILTVNDGGGITINEILFAAGRNEIIQATVDGDPISVAHLKKGQLTAVNAAQFCAEIGRETFKQALLILQKKTYKSKIFIPTYSINKNSVKNYPGWSGPLSEKIKTSVSHNQSDSVNEKLNSKMSIGVESICPYICEKNNQWSGYIADLILKFAKEKKIEIHFKAMPINRHTISIENKIIDAAITQVNMVRYHPKIQSIGKPIGVAYAGIMGKKDLKHLVISSLSDLKQFRIGMGPKSSSFLADEMKKMNFNVTHVTGVDSPKRLLKMLDVGRVDYIIDDFSILESLTFDKSKFKVEPTSLTGFNSISMASLIENKNALSFSNQLSEWVEKKRKDGSLKKILEEYGISDWDFVLR